MLTAGLQFCTANRKLHYALISERFCWIKLSPLCLRVWWTWRRLFLPCRPAKKKNFTFYFLYLQDFGHLPLFTFNTVKMRLCALIKLSKGIEYCILIFWRSIYNSLSMLTINSHNRVNFLVICKLKLNNCNTFFSQTKRENAQLHKLRFCQTLWNFLPKFEAAMTILVSTGKPHQYNLLCRQCTKHVCCNLQYLYDNTYNTLYWHHHYSNTTMFCWNPVTISENMKII